VTLLEIELTIDDNLEIFYKCIYEGDEVIVLAWFLTPSIDHYRWLCNPINQLPSNRNIEHLVPLVKNANLQLQFVTKNICNQLCN
jgi:hypothetical protein